jgi:hypothetical protein
MLTRGRARRGPAARLHAEHRRSDRHGARARLDGGGPFRRREPALGSDREGQSIAITRSDRTACRIGEEHVAPCAALQANELLKTYRLAQHGPPGAAALLARLQQDALRARTIDARRIHHAELRVDRHHGLDRELAQHVERRRPAVPLGRRQRRHDADRGPRGIAHGRDLHHRATGPVAFRGDHGVCHGSCAIEQRDRVARPEPADAECMTSLIAIERDGSTRWRNRGNMEPGAAHRAERER